MNLWHQLALGDLICGLGNPKAVFDWSRPVSLFQQKGVDFYRMIPPVAFFGTF
jgi:hypothetical protein